MHDAAFAYLTRMTAGLRPRQVVEIGARDINGSARVLFPGVPYTGIDIRPGPAVDVVADGATYEPPEPPDLVICMETLEHVMPDVAMAICANAHRMLASGGVFIVTAAGDGRPPHSAIDGAGLRDGESYQNVTAADLMVWLAPFRAVSIEVNAQARDIYARSVKAG